MLRLLNMKRMCWAAIAVVLTVSGCGQEPADPAEQEAQRGDAAVWDVDVEQPPGASSTKFTALVQRLGCASGETGEVLSPEVVEREDEVIVTFTVEPLPRGDYACPGNKQVAYTVPLSEPLGRRKLVDGACLEGRASTTALCLDGGQRWPSAR